MTRIPHTIIIGAGITGLSTAYALLCQGKGEQRVTVLEREGVDHERGTSHGFSRLLRFEYGTDLFYTMMVRLSLERWHRLEQVTGRELYIRSGVLTLGRRDDHCTLASYLIARSMGLPVEQLSEEECQRRFPQFDFSAFDTFLYNAEGGVLRASTCLQTLRNRICDMGGIIREGCHVIDVEHGNLSQPVQLRLQTGEKLLTDRVVVAAGPWVHSLLGYTKIPVRVTRQYLLYFAGLEPTRFAAGHFPAFLAEDLYGFPIHRGCNGWIKVASHRTGVPVVPDDKTAPEQAELARIKDQLCEVLPVLRHAQLARVGACMYDMSPDSDFILDRLPHDPRVIIASGLSGHGFKFGLLLGELLSSLVRDERPVVPLERFSLKRFAATPLPALSATSYALRQGVSR